MQLAKTATYAGRKHYKRGLRALDTHATNKLLNKIQPVNKEDLQEWANAWLAGNARYLTLPQNVTPIGRKNVTAFLKRLHDIDFRGDKALFNPRTFDGWYASRDRFANYVAKCVNFLAGLNVDVSNILRTLSYTCTYSYNDDTHAYLPEATKRHRDSHESDTNKIQMTPESAAKSLFHEFLHALHMNPYIAQAINKKGLVDTAVRKWAPYNILKKFYDLYYDDDDVFLLDKRRAKRAGHEYAGKTYHVYQDSPLSKTRSWYSQTKDGQIVRKQGYKNDEGGLTWFTDFTKQVPEKSVLRDLSNRTVRGSEYLSMLSNMLEQHNGRLNFRYAMDLLKRIKAAEKAQARQDALDNKF